MRAGEFEPAIRAGIEHQIQVGEFFGAADFIQITLAHIMADTESLGRVRYSTSGNLTKRTRS